VSIHFLEPGILDTVQDTGRYGYSASGINSNGAMDVVAALAANYLVGNNDDDAVIELHFPSAVIQFNTAALIAITGADLSPQLNDMPVAINTPLIVPANAVLQFKKIRSGARAYIAVKGGLDLPKWLNSYSTNIKAKAGGYNGRPFRKGDTLKLNTRFSFREETIRQLPWHADLAELYGGDNIIRVIKGKEYSILTQCSETIIDGNTFVISHHSDRMGYRLNGSPLQQVKEQEMISSAVTMGTIQLLPNGQLIILMADHQTTGGYPIIVHVISADIPKLAQMPVHTALRFQLVSLQEAEASLLKAAQHLHQLKNACIFRLNEFLQQHGLY
jgi:antagonist of KipI